MSQLGCGPQSGGIQTLIERTRINYVNQRDLGSVTELQVAMIWAKQTLAITDLVSCLGRGLDAAFIMFPERVMKLASPCFPRDIRLVYSTIRESSCTSSIDRSQIFYGYREGFSTMSSYSSIFYIGGPSPPQLPFSSPSIRGDLRLVSDWTGIAFGNVMYRDDGGENGRREGTLFYRPRESEQVLSFKITVSSNGGFRARVMTPLEKTTVEQFRPDLVFAEEGDDNVYTYIKAPYQELGGDYEFWWTPASFLTMQNIVQAATMRDPHKLGALRHREQLLSSVGYPIKLSMHHYPAALAKGTMLTGYNPELAVMAGLESMVANSGYGGHLLESAKYSCERNQPYLTLYVTPAMHAVIISLSDLTVNISRPDDPDGSSRSIINP